ncbi:MAG: TonB family protein [Candidatus Competibacteraceae bacterium]|nr:TonB family protein [Candidatus Competibacteraceae bacterium]
MSGIARDTEITGRLLLALLLASGLHLVLLFGVPADWWRFRHSKPPRFEVVLLPPAPVPAEPARGTSIPEPTTPAVAVPPSPVARPPEPVVSAKVAPPVSKPMPEPVEPARSPAPVTRIEPTVAAKPATSPKRPPPSKPKPPSSPKQPATSPKPKPPSSQKPARKVAAKSLAKPPRSSPSLAAKPAAPEPTRPPRVAKQPSAPDGTRARGPLNSAALLGQIASLDTEIQQRANAGVRSRRVNLADTRSMAGFYAADWARKVTRVGEMNFPDAARRLNLSAGPLLEVAIRADGGLRGVRILRSSGNAELDRAARRIVELAAPYPPFPAELRRQVDLLRIESPWRFDPGGRIRAR